MTTWPQYLWLFFLVLRGGIRLAKWNENTLAGPAFAAAITWDVAVLGTLWAGGFFAPLGW